MDQHSIISKEEAQAMADRAEEACKIVKQEMEKAEKETGQKMPPPVKWMINAMQDGLPLAFEMMPDMAFKQAKLMYRIMAYILGHAKTPYETE